ncbi:MAG: type IX secretion system outer membrane channel protein PorV [Bacteroidia bacterium]|nr:type IX secretion system outer membrane channel protein PorV [Bacteroidia bacterium]MBP9181193.1 type IX secretion system outer membrane channel protein PorV [Bacteroidia bacterium]MBP9725375.1 type IX secretion system outer membrane channel protein PorV [Bacteroidia bacterium]
MTPKIVASIVFLPAFALCFQSSKAQGLTSAELQGKQNVVTTAVPFLTITPDARHAGMGDMGVASTPDMNSVHWNAAKLAFIDREAGVSLSYTPWLRQLVPDVSLSYLSGYAKVGKRSTFGASFRYFSLGNIQFTDNFGNSMGGATPSEMAVDGAYATQLSRNFSMAIAMRFIYSNLAPSAPLSNGVQAKAGVAAGGDISMYYKNKMKVEGKKVDYAIGATITNIGTKITYTTAENRDFIPINLRVGTFFSYDIDEYNKISFGVDFNKLLVPTNPILLKTVNGQDSLVDGNPVIDKGKNPDVPVIAGMLQSFSDAPGGMKEELREISYSAGMEYWYDKQFAVRAGYFHESPYKGNRQYITFGAGLRYKVFGLDVAYLVPFQQRHPLENTLRFSLLFDIDAFKSQQNNSDAPSAK